MKKHKLTLVLCMLLLGKMVMAQSSQAIKDYIASYQQAAIEEMKRSGVPASITLAQGIHESMAGQSDLVTSSNNHFGIKCKSDWTGPYVLHDDDAKNERFRKYESAFESYKDHSDFLRNGSRYAFLFDLDPTDYEGWAKGLKKAGYATNPKYPQILIKLIEDYNLQDYTLIALGRKNPQQEEYLVSAPSNNMNNMTAASGPEANTTVRETSYPDGVFKINETNVVFVPKGTSFLAVAQQHHMSLGRLFEFNDMPAQDIATEDQLLYLQRKRKTGASETHKVLPGEDLYDIAQTEGIRMESLLDYNFLKADMQPQTGEVLYLHHRAPAMPKLALANSNDNSDKDNSVSINTTSYQQQIADSKNEMDAYVVHVVQPKETMYSIAKKYAVSTDEVLKWNGMQTPDLKIGQELRINKKSLNATN